jgi:hypothetical protein
MPANRGSCPLVLCATQRKFIVPCLAAAFVVRAKKGGILLFAAIDNQSNSPTPQSKTTTGFSEET